MKEGKEASSAMRDESLASEPVFASELGRHWPDRGIYVELNDAGDVESVDTWDRLSRIPALDGVRRVEALLYYARRELGEVVNRAPKTPAFGRVIELQGQCGRLLLEVEEIIAAVERGE